MAFTLKLHVIKQYQSCLGFDVSYAAMPQEGLQRMWALKGDLTEPENLFTSFIYIIQIEIN